jgi:hypothetical protein
MKFRTLKFLRRRKRERQKMERTERWVRYLIVLLWACLFLAISGCENTRHSIGVTGKPLATDGKFEDSVKFNYKIIFGKVRPKEDDDD